MIMTNQRLLDCSSLAPLKPSWHVMPTPRRGASTLVLVRAVARFLADEGALQRWPGVAQAAVELQSAMRTEGLQDEMAGKGGYKYERHWRKKCHFTYF